ncbi:MAG TPA: DUF5916 domain-containing protein [Vicinamibacterales bacterium]
MSGRRRSNLVQVLALAALLGTAAVGEAQTAGTPASTVTAPTAGASQTRAPAQPAGNPYTLKAGALSTDLRIDGILDEGAWATAEAIENLTIIEPQQGVAPTGRTRVRVLANSVGLVFGVECDDPNPRGIVSYTKQRDGAMSSEDHIEIVVDPFMDGRSGYVFWVNPSGARYDGLINPGSADVNSNWDGIWEAATKRTDRGWTAEVRIPIQTLSFAKGKTAWHFNIQRRIQRLQETDRWASPQRDYKITRMSRAGLLTTLPEFDLGLGLSVRPAGIAGGGVPIQGADFENDSHASLDVTQRLGPNLLASGSVNTDFAETEADARQTNLTRFSLYFPEKRTFFLEGADIFQFGPGGTDVVPFFSRRIGLVDGQQVPIRAAGKVNGRVGNTSVGALVARTGNEDAVAPAATMGVVRIKQNVLGESTVGMIATFGDPQGAAGSWLAGADFTYQTSRFRGDKNFLVGVWGSLMDRSDVAGDKTAAGFKVGYPNDLWNVSFSARRVGDGYQPSLGFVPRPGVYSYDFAGEFDPRPNFWHIRQMFNEFSVSAVTDLQGRWETYSVFTAPVNWRFDSGDRIEFNWAPAGDNLRDPFEISAGVVIPPGPYHWTRWRLEAGTANKRKLSSQITWRFGTFYSGSLDQVQLTLSWNPIALFTFSLSGEQDFGRLKEGDFDATLIGTRVKFNVSPNLNISSFVQYDTTSQSVGTNSQLRWTFRPVGDLFVIYNHNVRDLGTPIGWARDSNQLLIKMQYAFRY